MGANGARNGGASGSDAGFENTKKSKNCWYIFWR